VILGDDGQKLSKRRGAVSVTAYEEGGYLPEAMLNYLARLGWSHGDEELFSSEQLVAWFDGTHLNKSPAQWDRSSCCGSMPSTSKTADNTRLANLVALQLVKLGIPLEAKPSPPICRRSAPCSRTVATPPWRWPPGPPSFMAT
jgi:glutamyl-tRNA synthetase